MSSSNNSQARYWLLTLHQPTWTPPETLPHGVTWLRGQKEQGSNTGAIHWQLFTAFGRAVRLSAVKKIFGRGVHAEPSRSEAAEEYVFKDDTAIAGTRFELGAKAMKRNSKTDWAAVKELAKNNQLDQIEDRIYVQNYRTLKLIAMDNMVQPNDMPGVTGIWIHGPPGTGKSHYARANYGSSLYLKAQNKWWDGYQGQTNVLLDDLDSNCLSHYLKIWADKYAFMAECKGSSIQIRPKNFIVTSNYTPEQLFNDPVLAAAIRRRFYFIYLPMRMY